MNEQFRRQRAANGAPQGRVRDINNRTAGNPQKKPYKRTPRQENRLIALLSLAAIALTALLAGMIMLVLPSENLQTPAPSPTPPVSATPEVSATPLPARSLIESLQISAPSFSPQARETLNINFRLKEDCDVSVMILDSEGEIINILSEESALLANTLYTLAWDGFDGHGRLVSTGGYTVQVKAQNVLGQDSARAQVTVTDGEAPPTATPEVTPTQTPRVTPTPSPSPTPEVTPTPTPSPEITPTPTPSLEITPTPTPSPSPSPEVTPPTSPDVTDVVGGDGGA